MCHKLPDFTSVTHESLLPCCVVRDQGGRVTTVDASGSINGHTMIAAGGSDYALFLYEWKFDHLVLYWRICEAHSGVISAVLFGTGMVIGVLYSASYDGIIKLWSVSNHECVAELTYHTAKVVALTQSPDGRYLVSASADGSVLVYDTSTHYSVISRFFCDDEPISVTILNGYIVCGYSSGAVRLWLLPCIAMTKFLFVCFEYHKHLWYLSPGQSSTLHRLQSIDVNC